MPFGARVLAAGCGCPWSLQDAVLHFTGGTVGRLVPGFVLQDAEGEKLVVFLCVCFFFFFFPFFLDCFF